jgi:hemerythrin
MTIIILYLRPFKNIYFNFNIALDMEHTLFTEERIWTSEFESNHPMYDDHHRKFFEIINLLVKVIHNRSCEEEISLVFFRLIYYVEKNFVEEEMLLRESKYPEFRKQREEHAGFISQVVAFQQAYKEGDKRICQKLLVFLQDWFENHIMDSDMKAARYLLENPHQ